MNVNDPGPSAPPHGNRGRGALVTAWLVGACLLAGAAAETTGMPPTWGGSGPVFWEYAVPLWLSIGFMHLPGLVAGGLFLGWLHGRGPGDVSLGRWLLSGVAVAALVVDWDPVAWEPGGDPRAFFALVDALSLLAATMFLPQRHDGPWLRLPPGARFGALAAPVALVLVFAGASSLAQGRYQAVQSDRDPVTGETRYWAYLRAPVAMDADPAGECETLAEFALNPFGTYQHSSPGARTVYVFQSKAGASNRNPDTAWVSFRRSAQGEGECRGPGGVGLGQPPRP